MLIRPVVMYGSLVWASSRPTSLQKISTFERRVIRIITGLYTKDNGHCYSNETLYNNSNIRPFKKYARGYMWRQKKRFWRHHNTIIHRTTRTSHPRGPYIRTRDITKDYLSKFYDNDTSFIRG